MSYTTSIPITIGTAGLTLNAQLVTTAGANSGSVITTGIVEIANGYYMITASIPDGFQGGLKLINTADSSIVGFTTLNPPTDENADVKTSTRLASGSYTAPNNTDIAAIKATVNANLDAAISTRLAASGYTAPDNTDVIAIRAKVDSYLDAAISSRLASTGYTAPDNTSITAIKATVDTNLDTTVSSRLAASAYSAAPSAAAIADAVLDEALAGHTTAGTAGHALILARAQAAGKWVISGDVMSIYDTDGTTLLTTLHLAPAGGPYTSRTP